MQSCTRWHRAVARPAPFQPRGNARPCTPQTLHAATIKRLTIAARNSNSDTCQTTPEVSRRALLLAGALLPALSPAIPAHAAASAGSCELNAAESGLIYCDLVEGTGGVPTRGALVKVHYVATFAGSDVPFDSSYARQQPLIFKLGEREVIQGWDEGILGSPDVPAMKEGGKRRLVLPPGPQQRMGTKSLVWMVGMMDALEEAELLQQGQPTTDLIFELELLPTRRSRR